MGLFLKSQPGFGAIRRGGYAIDPVMRGFKYEQLNVQYDGGIKVSHACPNRMDPVTSHIRAQDLEKIEIIKGPYTVRYGQTMGGVVNLIQKRPTPTAHLKTTAVIESGYDSNGGSRTARAAATLTAPRLDVFASAGTQDAGNYQNGDGVEIPSSYRVNDYLLRVGFRPADHHHLQLSWRQSFVRDVLHAGLPMDSQSDDTDIWALDYAAQRLGSHLFSINAKAYGSFVNHVMVNTLRPNYNMMHARADVSTNISGGKIEIGLTPTARTLWHIGADAQHTASDGYRYRDVYQMNGMTFNSPRSFTDAIWQDSRMQDLGMFTEIRHAFQPRTVLVAGTRLDRVTANIDNPAERFTDEYGRIESQSETNISLTATLNHRLSARTSMQLAAGRGIRSANLAERYINHFNVGPDAYEYVGNPYLKPEINHQADFSLSQAFGSQSLRVNVYYALIDDFMSAYVDENLPRVYMPMQEPRYARRFTNLDRVRQTGFEISLQGTLGKTFSYSSSLGYTHATDFQNDAPLPEIPPLASHLSLRYSHPADHFYAETDMRLSARQGRVSELFGETETPGFMVLNLRTGIRWHGFAELTLSAENLFDKTYYEHLSRGYQNMPESGLLYEPGRNIALRLRLSH